MGADGRGERSGEGAVPPPQKKMNFYLKQVGFGAFYDYFLRLCPAPLNPPLTAHRIMSTYVFIAYQPAVEVP